MAMLLLTSSMTADKPKYSKPQKFQKEKPGDENDSSPDSSTCQHIRIQGCNESVRNIIYECYKCQQGLLTECSNTGKLQDVDVECPTCGKIAIKLTAVGKILSTTSIVSPWQ